MDNYTRMVYREHTDSIFDNQLNVRRDHSDHCTGLHLPRLKSRMMLK